MIAKQTNLPLYFSGAGTYKKYTEADAFMDSMNEIKTNLQVTDISLHVETKLPKKTRDIYMYLPYRMLSILPTVAKFSDIDLMTGKTNRRPFIYQTNRFKDSGSLLNLSNGVVFNKKSGMLKIGNQEVPVKEFLITSYDKNKKLTRQRQNIHKDGKIYLVYMRSYNTFLVLDEDMLNSTYIQLFVFENYDKNLFEPVVLDPSAKVFKLKI